MGSLNNQFSRIDFLSSCTSSPVGKRMQPVHGDLDFQRMHLTICLLDSATHTEIVVSVRHRRPRYAALMAADVLRPQRCCHQMVRVLLERPDAACENSNHYIAAVTCHVWSPAAVRCRPVAVDQNSPAVPSRLCRRHSNLRLLSAE